VAVWYAALSALHACENGEEFSYQSWFGDLAKVSERTCSAASATGVLKRGQLADKVWH